MPVVMLSEKIKQKIIYMLLYSMYRKKKKISHIFICFPIF